jgi:putative chitinase
MCISGSVGEGKGNLHADVKTIQILLNLAASKIGLASPLAEDGAFGSATRSAIEAFQRQVMTMATPDGVVAPGAATLVQLQALLGPGFDATKLKGIMLEATPVNLERYFPGLVTGMNARQINTPLRQAHFLAQAGHESAQLRYVTELASGEAYEGNHNLGNVERGDGPRFKGRGLIQLTGRANYTAYGKEIGQDLTTDNHWELVASDPKLAVDVACWFWDAHKLNQYADADDVETITRRINGGLNGIQDRKALLARAKFFLPPTQPNAAG